METEYRGYQIRFSEKEEKWGCYDIEFSHDKLSKVKERVDAMHLKLRKGAAFDCYMLGTERGLTVLAEAKVIDYIKPIREQRPGTFERVYTGPIIDHEFAVMAKHHGRDRMSRRACSLSNVIDLSAADCLAALNDLERQAADLAKRIADAKAALPRVRFDDLADLVKAASHSFTEGEATQ